MKKPIAVSLSPNSQKDDVVLALKLILQPVYWYDFTKTEILEEKFASYFGKGYKALAVNSGRSAEYLILKSLGVGWGDEVLVQALTCVAVPNPVMWIGARPVYVDVGDDFNIDPKDLNNKLGGSSKAVIIQNSFGIPADYNMIKKVIHKRNKKVYIIEDCALSMGAKYKNKQIGTLGDVAFFSFGRDKVISSVFGGMILCKNKKLFRILKKERDILDYPNPLWLIQQLLHPIVFSLALPLYNLGVGKITLGKIMIYISQKLKLISKSVYKDEEIGKKPKVFPAKLPGALSVLALNQFNKLEKYNSHRKRIARFYFNNMSKSSYILPSDVAGSIWVRFPVVRDDALSIFQKLKSKGILLGDWYKECVYPVKDLKHVSYIYGSCSNAESLRGKILNLPTYPGFKIEEAEYLLSLIK